MSKRVLILDDERDSNTTVEMVLQDNGFRVDSQEDPNLALENLKSCFYDLVILDIKMPQMNGFSVYTEIRRLDKSIKVCFLTAGDTNIFPSLPDNYFIRKPIGNKELLKRVHGIITTN